jgi:hypothetical protein
VSVRKCKAGFRFKEDEGVKLAGSVALGGLIFSTRERGNMFLSDRA